MACLRVLVCFVVFLLSGAAFAEEAERRVALVIGNSAYIRRAALANPVNDAKLMAARLKAQGFKVFASYDAGQRNMKRSMQDFWAALRAGGKDVVAFIFYAGHGVQVKGENYLIPVDENIKSEGDVDIDAVSLSSIMSMLENAQTRLAIVVLDACRDNPFGYARGGARGLAQVDAPSGSLIAFSTSPGKTAPDGPAGGNSYYTAALAQTMAEPGVNIEEVFKKVRIAVHGKTKGEQIPWESTSLTGDFYPAGASISLPEPIKAKPEKPKGTEIAAIGPAEQLPALKPPPELRAPVRTFVGNTDPSYSSIVRSVAFSPDGRTALSGDEYGLLKFWDITSGRVLHSFKGHRSGEVRSVAFSPDGRTALSGSRGTQDALKLWDVASGRELRSFVSDTAIVESVAFSPDGRTALSGGGRMLKLWDITSGRELLSGEADRHRVIAVAFSPDGRLAISGGTDEALKLWDIASGSVLRSFKTHQIGVDSIAISQDGRFALTGGSAYHDDEPLKLWELATGRELRRFAGHTKNVVSVAFSPDGRLALSCSYDEALTLWDIASGRALLSIDSSRVRSCAISPDGRTALSGDSNNTLNLWDISEWTRPQEARR
jgi:WD40 repeat protein